MEPSKRGRLWSGITKMSTRTFRFLSLTYIPIAHFVRECFDVVLSGDKLYKIHERRQQNNHHQRHIINDIIVFLENHS